MDIFAICADGQFYWDEEISSWVKSTEKFTISTDEEYLYSLIDSDSKAYVTELPNDEMWTSISVERVGKLF